MRRSGKAVAWGALLLLASCGGRAPDAGPSPSPTPTPTPSPSQSSSPSISPTPSPAPVVAAGRDAWVAVSVATVWRSPDSPRPVDAPALANPVDLEGWLGGMTTAQRRALGPDLAETQALLGERVRVLAVTGGWAKVVVPAQATPRDSRGYPGWIPVRQLSAVTPPAGRTIVTVTARTTLLRTRAGKGALEASYGTRLPLLRRAGSGLEVWVPGGRTLVLDAEDAVALQRTAPAIVADARRFIGVAYLWAGTSAFGFDCSGFAYTVFRAHGILLPRDSSVQAGAGTAVPRAALRPGDLVFFARGGAVYHVGLYIGDGRMIEAPGTGQPLRITPLSNEPYDSQFSGARRFLP